MPEGPLMTSIVSILAGSNPPLFTLGMPFTMVGCTAKPRIEKYSAPSPPLPVDSHRRVTPVAFFMASLKFVTTCSDKSLLEMELYTCGFSRSVKGSFDTMKELSE